MINAAEIKSALELLDPANDAHWQANGDPSIEALRGLMGEPSLTPDDVDVALDEKPFKRPGSAEAKAQRDTGSKAASDDSLAPAQKAPTPRPEAKPENVSGDTAAPVETRSVREIEEERAALRAKIEALDTEQDEAIKAQAKTAPPPTDQNEQAKMVKRIQEQTVEQNMRRRAMQAAAADKLAELGITQKPYASPLDAAMAAGGRRSTVIRPGPDGKPTVYTAPHPRSAEGIRNMATYIHQPAGRGAVQ